MPALEPIVKELIAAVVFNNCATPLYVSPVSVSAPVMSKVFGAVAFV